MDLDTQANPLMWLHRQPPRLPGGEQPDDPGDQRRGTLNERSLDLPMKNFRLISIDFDGDEGWIAGQPGLLMHSDDGGQNWTRHSSIPNCPASPT